MTWLLSVLGALLSSAAFVVLWKRHLNAELFLDVLAKLTRAGNFDRARKLCSAVGPWPPLGSIAAAGFALQLPRVVLREGAATFRQAPEQLSFEQRAREVLAPLAAQKLASARRFAWGAAIGVLLAAVSLLPPWPPLATILGVAGVVLGLLALRCYFAIRRGVAAILDRLPGMLLPEDEMHRNGGMPALAPPETQPARAEAPADEPAETAASTEPFALPFPKLPPLPLPPAPPRTFTDPVLATALARQDWSRACEHLDQLADLPHTAPLRVVIEQHLHRADLLDGKLGDIEAACDAFRTALDLEPDNRYALARLAQLHRASERHDALEATLESWSETNADASVSVTLLLHLARLRHEQLDKTEPAREALLHALLIAPDDEVAQAALKALGE